MPGQRLPRVLGSAHALSVVIGGVLGASVFIVPAGIAQSVPSIGGIALLWLLGGLFSLAGALTLAELSAMLPGAGGAYVYLHRTFGPLAAFLFSWSDFLLVRSGAVAALAVGSAIYLSELAPAPAVIPVVWWQAAIGTLFVSALALLNIAGTRLSASIQLATTVAKVCAVTLLIVLPFIIRGQTDTARLHPFWPGDVSLSFAGSFLAAFVPVLWSFGGWDQLGHLAEEIRDPGRNVPRALSFGLAFLTLLYLGVVFAVHMVLPIAQVAASPAVGAEVFRRLLGSAGVLFISIVVMFATLTSAHMALLSGPRSVFAFARDGLAPQWLAAIHPRFQTPANAIAAMAGWAIFLILSNAAFAQGRLFDVLITYVMTGLLVFNGATMVCALLLRRREPGLPRPYRTPFWPLPPVAALTMTFFLLAAIAARSPIQFVTGVGLMAIGVIVFFRAIAGRNLP